MPTDLTPEARLHKLYCEVSEYPLSPTLDRFSFWSIWINHGWTDTDLIQVLVYLKGKIKAGQHWARNAIMFSTLIRDTARFEELLAEVKAHARVKQVNLGKAQALRATGRDATAPTSEPRSAAQVLRGDEALKALLQLRDSL